MQNVGSMSGWTYNTFIQRMPRAQAVAAGFLGAATGNSDLDRALDGADALEQRVLALRTELVRAGLKRRSVGQVLPADAVEGYNAVRRKTIDATVHMIAQIIANVEALPIIGPGRAAELNAAVGTTDSMITAYYQRIPLLPRELVPPKYVSSFSPSLTPQEASFGFAFLAGPVGYGIAILLAGVAVWIAAKAIGEAFNSQAATINADSDHLAAWAQGQVARVNALKAAGFTPEQIQQQLDSDKPPAPPDAGFGLTHAVLAVSALVAVLGVLKYTKRI